MLDSGTTIVEKADATFVPEIKGAASIGQLQLTAPCCAGPGKFMAGGTLAPLLVGGHPKAKADLQVVLLDGGAFSGTFKRFGKGFTADYKHETATPAFVGAVYTG